jgi:hypothetical protein
MTLQRHPPSIPLLTQDAFTAATLPDHVVIVICNDRWCLDLAAATHFFWHRKFNGGEIRRGECDIECAERFEPRRSRCDQLLVPEITLTGVIECRIRIRVFTRSHDM